MYYIHNIGESSKLALTPINTICSNNTLATILNSDFIHNQFEEFLQTQLRHTINANPADIH